MKDPNMKKTDKSRKWMWWFLVIVGATQLYFVRELLAAFALFAAVFAVVGAVVAGGYLLHKGLAVAIERVAASSHPLVSMVKRGADSVEDLAGRPLRRPSSEAAAQ
jgi:apolipoprotein N-acyltransferase